MQRTVEEIFRDSPLILTEGAIGLRMELELGFAPDRDVANAAYLYRRDSRAALEGLYRQYLAVAERHDLPILLMTNTRRANRERAGRSAFRGRNIMRDYAEFLRGIAADYRCESRIGGLMGCRGDAYAGHEGLAEEDALAFHAWQVEWAEAAPLDYLFAAIMPCCPEAIGMARAMARSARPYIVSLMLGGSGTLLDGTALHEAIAAIDRAAALPPLCYMANCIHPAVLGQALRQPFNQTDAVRARFCGIQANAACGSPSALDGSAQVHSTSPAELGDAFQSLCDYFPLKILGGCCGTDEAHIEEIARRFKPAVSG